MMCHLAHPPPETLSIRPRKENYPSLSHTYSMFDKLKRRFLRKKEGDGQKTSKAKREK